MPTTTTTTTTVTRRIRVPVPKRAPRLVQRKRKIVIRNVKLRGGRAVVRRKAGPPVRRAEVVTITTTTPRALPAPKKHVSELTVKERQKLPAPK